MGNQRAGVCEKRQGNQSKLWKTLALALGVFFIGRSAQGCGLPRMMLWYCLARVGQCCVARLLRGKVSCTSARSKSLYTFCRGGHVVLAF